MRLQAALVHACRSFLQFVDAMQKLARETINSFSPGPEMAGAVTEDPKRRVPTRDRLRDVEPNDIQRQRARKLLNTEEKSKK